MWKIAFKNLEEVWFTLKVQSCKLHNDKYIMASTNLRNTEIFALIAILVFKLLSRRVLIISRKTIETVKK